MVAEESVIPAPLVDDDDDVAWALQTAAVQWQRGQRADAVVWLRRAVDAAITAGNPGRTNDLTKLASDVADRLVAEAMAAPDSMAPPGDDADSSDVDDLLTADSMPPAPVSRPRSSAHSLTSEIPVEFDDGLDSEDPEDEDFDDDAPTIPPASLAASDEFEEVTSDEDEQDVTADELFSTRPSMGSEMPVSADEIFSSPPTSLEQSAETSDVVSEPPERGPLDEPFGVRVPHGIVVKEIDEEQPAPSTDPAPERLPEEPPESASSFMADTDPNPPHEVADRGGADDAGSVIVGGIPLDQVRGLEDLPELTQQRLARSAVLTELSAGEDVGFFGAALVTHGKVGIMPAIADVAATIASPGEIVFTRGTLEEAVSLRVVAMEDGTIVASWTAEDLATNMADCPWVADELRLVADRFQALAGATLGALGDRLDDALRAQVLSRLDVKAYGPGEIIVTAGKPIPGLHVVGAGRVELVENDAVKDEITPGDFLFAAEVLGAGKPKSTARAGKTGALVLFAPRSLAHELFMSVPPLLEILSG